MRNLDFLIPQKTHVGADGTDSVQDAAILHLAHATINLSQVAPQLSELASSRQADAEHQADDVHDIANTVRNMSTTLEQTVHQLSESTREISELTELIQRIANETRMIAINAGIAAAHAGEQGRVFSLLAKEIRALSENTAVATKDVKAKIERLQESTNRTAQVIGLEKSGIIKKEQKDTDMGLAWLLERMNEADESASRQASEARQLNVLGLHLRGLSEEMIRSIGAFRLEVHDRVEDLLSNFRLNHELLSGDPRWQITALRQIVKNFPFIELAYVTDASGIQTTENVFNREFCATYGDSGKNKNWSQRPWFTGAMKTNGIYLSDIYRSQATDEFCLTASATLINDGIVIGVIAIDVNFRELLGNEGIKN